MEFVEVFWIIFIIVVAFVVRWIRILRINSELQIEQNKRIISQLEELNQTLKNNQK